MLPWTSQSNFIVILSLSVQLTFQKIKFSYKLSLFLLSKLSVQNSHHLIHSYRTILLDNARKEQ